MLIHEFHREQIKMQFYSMGWFKNWTWLIMENKYLDLLKTNSLGIKYEMESIFSLGMVCLPHLGLINNIVMKMHLFSMNLKRLHHLLLMFPCCKSKQCLLNHHFQHHWLPFLFNYLFNKILNNYHQDVKCIMIPSFYYNWHVQLLE